MDATLDTNIKHIEDAKASIRSAIEAKGVAVPQDALIDTYADRLDEIKAGKVKIDLAGTGWETEPIFSIDQSRADNDTIKADLDNTRDLYTAFGSDAMVFKPEIPEEAEKTFENNDFMVYAPKVDVATRTNMNDFFGNCILLFSVPALDLSNTERMYRAFRGCKKLTIVPSMNTPNLTGCTELFNMCQGLERAPFLDLDNVDSMTGFFASCTSLKYVPSYCTSNVRNMSLIFDGCISIEDIPWMDTRKVTDFSSAFSGCENLKRVPTWDYSSGTDMRSMFSGCKSIKKIYGSFKTTSAKDLFHMFSGCSSLTDLPELDFNNVRFAENMFSGCTELKTVGGFNGMKVSFSLADSTRLTKASLVNILNKLGKAEAGIEASPVLTLSASSKGLLNPQDIAIASGKGWTIK